MNLRYLVYLALRYYRQYLEFRQYLEHLLCLGLLRYLVNLLCLALLQYPVIRQYLVFH